MDWSYIAGFFDGEGTPYFYKRNNTKYARLQIGNTNQIAIQQIKDFIGKGHIWAQKRKRKKHHKTMYYFGISDHNDVLEIAEKLISYCIIKKEGLQKLITFIKSEKWSPHNALKNITEKEFRYYYEENQMSVGQIAKKLGVYENAILLKFKKFGIKRRNRSEAIKIYLKRRENQE